MLTREANPKGRLFAIDVGDECSINGHDYTVLEKMYIEQQKRARMGCRYRFLFTR